METLTCDPAPPPHPSPNLNPNPNPNPNSYQVEFLNLDWRHGEWWFHETLVDADQAINAFMWQNGGHSGFDQASRDKDYANLLTCTAYSHLLTCFLA